MSNSYIIKLVKDLKKKYGLLLLMAIIVCTGAMQFFSILNKSDNSLARMYSVQIKMYRDAIKSFSSQYGYIPGDIPNAYILGLGSKFMDGDGDGEIEDAKSLMTKSNTNSIEEFSGEISSFWLHLSNSDMLDYRFNGKPYYKGAKIGTSIPLVKGKKNIGIIAFGYKGRNYFQLGISSISNHFIQSRNDIMTPHTAFVIDKKFDDGYPHGGEVVVVGSGVGLNKTDTISNHCVISGEYNLKHPNNACQLRIDIIRK